MSQIDVAPTLLSLLGVDKAERQEMYSDLHGHDMSDALAAGAGPREQTGILINVGNVIFLDPNVGRNMSAGMSMAEASARRDNSLRGMARGVHDGRWKFMRWFAPIDHHVPQDFETLIARNDIELYDTEMDPYEINNLAVDPQAMRETLLKLNEKCNRLIADEVGIDDGRLYRSNP
jgi:arylsulfatase